MQNEDRRKKANEELASLYDDKDTVDSLKEISAPFFDAVAEFWATPFRGGALTPKVKELVCIAIHASASTLNQNGIKLHIDRALKAGATPGEVTEVLVAIATLGVHTFSVGIPALLEELRANGREAEADLPPMTEELTRIKEDFVRNRGYWTDQRETLARLVPEFFKAYMALSYEPWKTGVLDPKTKELIYVAIDSSITHMYEYGLRIHIRNALKHGATRDEITEVFQLAALLGVSTYVSGTRQLLETKA